MDSLLNRDCSRGGGGRASLESASMLRPLRALLLLALAACAAPAGKGLFDRADFDPAVSPAEDFFLHVNGPWLRENPIPPDRTSWGTFEILEERSRETLLDLLEGRGPVPGAEARDVERIRSLWRAAMDEEAVEAAGLAPLRPWLEAIASVQSTEDYKALLPRLQEIGVAVPIGLGILPDPARSSHNTLLLAQDGLSLPEPEAYFRDDEDSVRIRRRFVEHAAALLTLTGIPAEEALPRAEAVLSLETALAEKALRPIDFQDPQVLADQRPVAELASLAPSLELAAFLERSGLGRLERVNVVGPGWFQNLDRLLGEVELRIWKDHLRYHLADGFSPLLSAAFVEEHFDFHGRALSGLEEMEPRWKRMLEVVEGSLGEALGRVYVARAFPPEAKERARFLVGRLLDAFRERLETVEWMGPETRSRALEKLDTFRVKIGYPDRWPDDRGLTVEREGLVAKVLEANRFLHQRELAKAGQPVDPDEWGMTPQTINAYYNPLANEIVFPAAILQPPFFDPMADDAVNLGAMGAVIGHEITHGFDDFGSQFDARGELRNWWTEEDRQEFERRAEVLVQQYDAYEALPGLHVDGRLTLGENIADLGGLRMAWAALQRLLEESGERGLVDGFTPEQRFFLSWARSWRSQVREERLRTLLRVDSHAPAHFRCNGPLSNMPVFAEAFGIVEGAPMARPVSERAVIW